MFVLLFARWDKYADLKYNFVHISGCLPILPVEDLELLDILVSKGSKGPVKDVIYISEENNPYSGESLTFTHENKEAVRFNLFTGYQSLVQREKSFKVGIWNLKVMFL